MKAPKPGLMSRVTSAYKTLVGHVEMVGQINESASYADSMSVSMLLGSSNRPARSRQQIYEKWHHMSGDPIIAMAMRLHVTQALGGHETTGDVIFIEPATDKQNAAANKAVEELRNDLVPIFNKIAAQVCINGLSFGDAYARIYAKEKVGITSLYVDEMVFPPMVQPYEQGNTTVGFVVSAGKKFITKLSTRQMARLRLPRMLYVPQDRVLEKAVAVALEEDDEDKLPVLPSLVGGSILDAAEEPFDKLQTALVGLVGQRVLSSMDETLVMPNMDGMTADQRKEFMNKFTGMLTASKRRAENAIKSGKPILERLYHILPIFGDKQTVNTLPFKGGEVGTITVDDVLFHARRLAGALGIDLSMLGFADQLSGGLGDGGFFRVSAQAAEMSRVIRTSLTEFFDHLIDIHTLNKYGYVFEKSERPYKLNFYGSISALETERQRTRESATNAGMATVQVLDQLRNIGLDEKAITYILDKVMQLDEAGAKLLAKSLANAKPPDSGGGFGGGFGGGDDQDNPANGIDVADDEQQQDKE